MWLTRSARNNSCIVAGTYSDVTKDGQPRRQARYEDDKLISNRRPLQRSAAKIRLSLQRSSWQHRRRKKITSLALRNLISSADSMEPVMMAESIGSIAQPSRQQPLKKNLDCWIQFQQGECLHHLKKGLAILYIYYLSLF